jgi:hypothetical protein
MRSIQNKTPWESHDWKVKTLESISAGGGSKLSYTCRACERKFTYTSANNRAWATSDDGTALADEVSARWLAQRCPRLPGERDDRDRMTFKYQPKPNGPT